VKLTILEFTNVFVPTGKGIGALSVGFAVLVFTNVFAPIGEGSSALSVEFVILELTDVCPSFEFSLLNVETSKAIVPSTSLLN